MSYNKDCLKRIENNKDTHYWEKREKAPADWYYYKPYLATCIKYSNPGKILDVGAGMGGFTECCARFGLDCVGLEGDDWAVKQAKKRYDMDIRQHFLEYKLPFNDGEFSVIFCSQVIEHLSEKTAKFALKEFYRVLSDGGTLFIHSPCYYVREARIDPTHINLYIPKRLCHEIIEAGFNIVIPMTYPRGVIGGSVVTKAIMTILFVLFPCDRLAGNSSLMAKKTSDKEIKIFSPRYFHIQRIIHW